ncbi:hypothetical protein P9487_05070 [Bacillus cereus]|uniref:hypothetical protein n=1 Tax=Bacillus TaxID=1386 RepID=UPI00077A0A52|nr:hypothetical protein [Bacillus cereus]KXX91207.1 hypothetical protein AT266_22755 [Bacillus cereus]MED4641073.1 hypothetical protein [Bacillus cereus]
MKLTLFTISNEQIKEQLSKLQTKVDSLETVKDVQDKIISAKDSQVSFLSDQTANMLSIVSLFVGIAGIIASGAFIYISYVNRQSQKALKTAEERIHAAEEQNQRAQERITEAEEKIQQANSISILAQEKLDELEIKQQEVNQQAEKLKLTQKADTMLNTIKHQLDLLKRAQETIKKSIDLNFVVLNEEETTQFNNYISLATKLESNWESVSFGFNTAIVSEQALENNEEIEELLASSGNLFIEYLNFQNNLKK